MISFEGFIQRFWVCTQTDLFPLPFFTITIDETQSVVTLTGSNISLYYLIIYMFKFPKAKSS